jgi:hypothetical protein
MAAPSRTSLPKSVAAFSQWLAKNPVDGDRPYGSFGVRYHVARFCEYLEANPWADRDPLADRDARDGAIDAYREYLVTFNTPAATIDLILSSVDRFYVFLGLGVAHSAPTSDGTRGTIPVRRG